MISIKCVKSYCCEDISLIENYLEAINSPEKWECHHRNEIIDNKLTYSSLELMGLNLFWHRPASELIFLHPTEHRRLHNAVKIYKTGYHNTTDSNIKRSNSLKGKPKSKSHCENISKGRKGIIFTPEHRDNISKSHKGLKHSKEHKQNISKSLKGNHPCPTKGMHRVYDNQEHTKFHMEF